jgi:hypothetical protein
LGIISDINRFLLAAYSDLLIFKTRTPYYLSHLAQY